MEDIINLLNQHNIPYNLRDKKDNIIIIPNGVIKIKKYSTIRNNQDIIDYSKQLNKLSYHYNLPLYSLFLNINNNDTSYINIINQNIDISRILLCSNINEIIVGEYCYAIRTTGAIWTITTLFDTYYPIIKDKLIITTVDTYKRAIVIMTDEEVGVLHKYNINIIEGSIESNLNIIYITQDTFKERELFTFRIDYVPLNGGNRSPCRVVDGITTICPNCNNIVYYNPDGTIRKHGNCVN
uniref:Uncharacterized protein n=1 Tax=viral metagenome TaxID=1070528 RepID=A0A6C0HVA4_9ZZZZ